MSICSSHQANFRNVMPRKREKMDTVKKSIITLFLALALNLVATASIAVEDLSNVVLKSPSSSDPVSSGYIGCKQASKTPGQMQTNTPEKTIQLAGSCKPGWHSCGQGNALCCPNAGTNPCGKGRHPCGANMAYCCNN